MEDKPKILQKKKGRGTPENSIKKEKNLNVVASGSFFYTLFLCNAAGRALGQPKDIARPTSWPFFIN